MPPEESKDEAKLEQLPEYSYHEENDADSEIDDSNTDDTNTTSNTKNSTFDTDISINNSKVSLTSANVKSDHIEMVKLSNNFHNEPIKIDNTHLNNFYMANPTVIHGEQMHQQHRVLIYLSFFAIILFFLVTINNFVKLSVLERQISEL